GNNEDCLVEVPEIGLFGVCDGLGGHAAGEIASSIASSTLEEIVKESSEAPEKVLKAGVKEANSRIFRHQQDDPDSVGMGTTLSVVWLNPEDSLAWIAHVGDSRIYLQRGQELKQITEDHSPVYRLYMKGLLTKEQMQRHPQKNLVERSLGVLASVKADCFPLSLDGGDLMLICSDGLTDYVTDHDIHAMLSDHSPEDAVDELIDAANGKGGLDNITLVLIRIMQTGESEPSLDAH
ncbi:MAG: PP2C family serine/threonine-protein phosphatase, partial [Acidobacteriota bacterium]